MSMFSQIKRINEKGSIVLYLTMALISGSIEDRWIFGSASAFNLFYLVALIDIYQYNQASCRYVIGKGSTLWILCNKSGTITSPRVYFESHGYSVTYKILVYI